MRLYKTISTLFFIGGGGVDEAVRYFERNDKADSVRYLHNTVKVLCSKLYILALRSRLSSPRAYRICTDRDNWYITIATVRAGMRSANQLRILWAKAGGLYKERISNSGDRYGRVDDSIRQDFFSGLITTISERGRVA